MQIFFAAGLSYVTLILIGKMCASAGDTVGQHEGKSSAALLGVSDI